MMVQSQSTLLKYLLLVVAKLHQNLPGLILMWTHLCRFHLDLLLCHMSIISHPWLPPRIVIHEVRALAPTEHTVVINLADNDETLVLQQCQFSMLLVLRIRRLMMIIWIEEIMMSSSICSYVQSYSHSVTQPHSYIVIQSYSLILHIIVPRSLSPLIMTPISLSLI